MNLSSSIAEGRLASYLKSVASLAPPLGVWSVCAVFVFPKLKQLWVDAGFLEPAMQRFMHASDFVFSHGVLFGVSIVAFLGVLEWRKSGWWSRHRRTCLGTLVYILNLTVLIMLLAMLCSAVIVAASFARPR